MFGIPVSKSGGMGAGAVMANGVTDDHIRSTATIDPLVSLGYRAGKRLAQALGLCGYFGFAGLLVDVDHIPWMLSQLLPEVYGSLASLPARFAHRFVFRGLLVILCCLVAYVAGRLVVIAAEL